MKTSNAFDLTISEPELLELCAEHESPSIKQLIQALEKKSNKSCSQVWHDGLLSCAEYTGIFNGKITRPTRHILLAAAIGLLATAEEIEQLFKAAGFYFPHNMTDAVVKYYAANDFYCRDEELYGQAVDITRINMLLAEHKLSPLGSKSRKEVRTDGV